MKNNCKHNIEYRYMQNNGKVYCGLCQLRLKYKVELSMPKIILEEYTFNDLLREISQLESINSQTVREQARASIEARYKEAMRILNANLLNLVAYVLENKEATTK